jgi:hypothetical protein
MHSINRAELDVYNLYGAQFILSTFSFAAMIVHYDYWFVFLLP